MEEQQQPVGSPPPNGGLPPFDPDLIAGIGGLIGVIVGAVMGSKAHGPLGLIFGAVGGGFAGWLGTFMAMALIAEVIAPLVVAALFIGSIAYFIYLLCN